MASSPRRDPAAQDNPDDLFDNYDVAADPFATDLPTYKPPSPSGPSKKRSAAAALGIDSAVEVTKKARAPRAKLDEERLLSAAGIPKLRARAANLRLRGRRHEYSDTAQLLRFYQLWLDDLFPKARFLDAHAMVEKLGHKKRIQMMRRAWIDGGRPGGDSRDGGGGDEAEMMEGLFDDPALPPRELRVAPIFETRTPAARPLTPPRGGDVPDDVDDLYDASPRRAPATATTHTSIFGPPARAPPDDDDDDALAALLAEAEMDASAAAAPAARRQPDEEDEDDLDALLAEAEMADARPAGGLGKGGETRGKGQELGGEDADVDEDDMDALAAMGGWGGE